MPGDGVHVVWQELLGVNRGRAFVLLADRIDADEARRLGLYQKVAEDASQAWELAREKWTARPQTGG